MWVNHPPGADATLYAKEETQVLSHRADSTTSRESAPSFVYSMAEHTPPPATQGVVWLDDDGPASCASAPVRTVLIASSAVPAHHVPPTPHVDSDTVAPGGTEAVASVGMPVDRLGISVNSELGGGGGGEGGEPEESAYAGDAVQPASVHCAATATYTGAAPSFVYCTYEHVLCPDVQSAGGSATSEDTTDGPSCTHASDVPLHHAPGSPHVPTVKTAPAATLPSATEDAPYSTPSMFVDRTGAIGTGGGLGGGGGEYAGWVPTSRGTCPELSVSAAPRVITVPLPVPATDASVVVVVPCSADTVVDSVEVVEDVIPFQ